MVTRHLFKILVIVGVFFSLLGAAHYFTTANNTIDRDGDVVGRDFLTFYTAAKMAENGQAELAYNVDAHHQAQKDFRPQTTHVRPWYYPPAALIVVKPFANNFSFDAGFVAWTVVGFSVFLLCLFLIGARGWVLLLGATTPTTLSIISGQFSFYLTALFTLALHALLRGQQVLAGLCFGLLTIKPQMGILIPFALLAARQWVAIVYAVLTAVVLHGAAYSLYGEDAFRAFTGVGKEFKLFLFSELPERGDPAIGISNIFGFLRTIGVTASYAMAAQIVVAGLCLAATVKIWMKGASNYAAAMILGLTCLAAPYIMAYELLLLVPAVVFAIAVKFDYKNIPLQSSFMVMALLLSGLSLATSHDLGVQVGWVITLFLVLNFYSLGKSTVRAK